MEDQKYYRKQREAIMNDSLRRELFRELFELYANSMPIILKSKNGQIQCFHADKVEELAEKIRLLIRERDIHVFETTPRRGINRHYDNTNNLNRYRNGGIRAAVVHPLRAKRPKVNVKHDEKTA